MSDGMLRDIVEIERQIEADLKVERARAESWVEEQKNEIDHLSDQELARVTSKASISGENRCQVTRDTAARQLRTMRSYVRLLYSTPDMMLRQVVQRYLLQIMSGVHHDHTDEQT